MKLFLASVIAFCFSHLSSGQALTGTWQLIDEKTCFQSEMKESATELELKDGMGASRNSVAKMITFSKKGTYEEGIYSQGKKKGSDKNKFNYRVTGQELQLLDKKSGIATQRFIIDELSASTLRFHNALKDCESKTFTRIE
jgi:Lipocalin-like domain